LAEAVVIDYLDNGVEFSDVHEHEEAEGLTEEELRKAHDTANAYLAFLAGEVCF
jgi:hypothetical protein